ncbi:MAG: cell division protein ZipA C-terminal FtsZ-binding domain-containing protein [Gammaproteobacteria bacterium]|nr:cell division protein ZipA C-terminal FtsZ-binding domain-containing protein [Gammaproteobacteria bacterium]
MWEHIIKQYQSLLPILGLVAVLLIIMLGMLSALGRKKSASRVTEPTFVEDTHESEEMNPEAIVISKGHAQADEQPISTMADILAPPSEEELAMAALIAETGGAAALAATHDEPQQEQISFADEEKTSWHQAVKESLQRRLGKHTNDKTLPDPGFIVLYMVAHRSVRYLGPSLVSVLKVQGLHFNDRQIFEHSDEEGVNFMVASAVNPGTFPLDSLSTFTTPGLSFILDLADAAQPKQAFIKMLDSISIIAKELEGDILDDQRQRLTEGAINEIMLKINILEQSRKYADA